MILIVLDKKHFLSNAFQGHTVIINIISLSCEPHCPPENLLYTSLAENLSCQWGFVINSGCGKNHILRAAYLLAKTQPNIKLRLSRMEMQRKIWPSRLHIPICWYFCDTFKLYTATVFSLKCVLMFFFVFYDHKLTKEHRQSSNKIGKTKQQMVSAARTAVAALCNALVRPKVSESVSLACACRRSRRNNYKIWIWRKEASRTSSYSHQCTADIHQAWMGHHSATSYAGRETDKKITRTNKQKQKAEDWQSLEEG